MGREGAPWQSHVFLCHQGPPHEAGPGVHSAPRAPAVHSSTRELLLPAGCVKWSAALGSGPAPGLSPGPWPLRMRSRWSHGCAPTVGRWRSAPATAQVWAPTWRSRARSAGRARPCCGRPCSAFPPCGQKQWLKAGPSRASPARPPVPPTRHPLLADVLGATAVLVLEGRQNQLVALEAALLHAGERWGWGFSPLRDEHDEGQGLWRALKQFLWEGSQGGYQGLAFQAAGSLACQPSPHTQSHTHLKVRDHGVHELLTEGRVGLEGTAQWREVQAGPGGRGERVGPTRTQPLHQEQVPPPPQAALWREGSGQARGQGPPLVCPGTRGGPLC